jgi:hypothetical protein
MSANSGALTLALSGAQNRKKALTGFADTILKSSLSDTSVRSNAFVELALKRTPYIWVFIEAPLVKIYANLVQQVIKQFPLISDFARDAGYLPDVQTML